MKSIVDDFNHNLKTDNISRNKTVHSKNVCFSNNLILLENEYE